MRPASEAGADSHAGDAPEVHGLGRRDAMRAGTRPQGPAPLRPLEVALVKWDRSVFGWQIAFVVLTIATWAVVIAGGAEAGERLGWW